MQSEFSKILKREIKNEYLIKFLDSHPGVKSGFLHNGWIGGGFARAVFKCHKAGWSYRDYLFDKKGDIDFFFKKDITCDLNPLYNTHKTAFALNYRNSEYKIQFVTGFVYESIEKMFEGFDFYNSCYAITKKRGKYYVEYLEKARELDERKILGVKHSNSPFTLQRMAKYLTSRDLIKISKESDEIVYDVLVRAASETFDSKFRHILFEPYAQKCLSTLFGLNLISKENLILFLGKYKISYSSARYGPTITEDWAKYELEKDAKRAKPPAA